MLLSNCCLGSATVDNPRVILNNSPIDGVTDALGLHLRHAFLHLLILTTNAGKCREVS